MSSFSVRRSGPNVSQYLANLNHINPSPSDTPAAAAAAMDDFSLTEDLAIFSNMDFIDFDAGNPHDPLANVLDFESSKPAALKLSSADTFVGNGTLGLFPFLL